MRRRSFLCLCFRIFFRRFLTTLAIHTPWFLPRAESGNWSPIRVSLLGRQVIETEVAEVTQRPKKCQETRGFSEGCLREIQIRGDGPSNLMIRRLAVRCSDSNKDPFDEILLVQAQEEGLKLLTIDRHLIGHPLAVRA